MSRSFTKVCLFPIKIRKERNELLFICSGQFAKAEIRRCECDGNMQFIQKKNDEYIIQGEFSLKNLNCLF